MSSGGQTTRTSGPSDWDVRREVARLLAAPELAHAPRLASLLRFVIEETLHGRAATLKEARIGLEVFGRRPDSYDPAIDPIVRVQMGRLRAKLRSHYSRAPAGGEIRIDVPPGRYVPTFHTWHERRSTTGPPGAVAPDASEDPRLAVLPFVNMSADPGDEYFCDGLTEELINRLAGTPGMRVVARTSSFQFKGAARDVREVGRLLDAGQVLEGSVRRTGGRMRVTVQLINTTDGCHVWSDRYEGDLTDIFAIHEQIATAIQQALHRRLAGRARARGAETRALEAYNHYLQGRFLWNRRTEQGLRAALQHLDRAVAIDSSFARAYAGQADCHLLLGMSAAESPEASMPHAAAAARRALQLDAGLAEAHTSLAAVHNCYEWRWDAALSEYLQALSLDSTYATAHHWLGLFYHGARGRLADARECLEHAIELDPLSPPMLADLGLVHALAGEVAPTEMYCRRALELDPHFHRSFWFLGLSLAWSGQFDAAVRELLRGVDACHGTAFRTRLLGALGFAYGRLGDEDRAREVERDLDRSPDGSYIPSFELAQVAAGLGDRGRTLALLEDAVSRHETFAMFLAVWPSFREYRREPRFERLLRAVGLLR